MRDFVSGAYTVRISNKRQHDVFLRLGIRGLAQSTMAIANAAREDAGTTRVRVHPTGVSTLRVLVTVAAASGVAGSTPVSFFVVDENGNERASHDAVFVGSSR